VVESDTQDNPNPGTQFDPAASETPALVVAPFDEQSLAAQLRRTGELISTQRLAEAEAELLAAQSIWPVDLRVLKLLALVRFKLGRLAEARQVYRQAAEVAVDDATIRLNLGLIALKLESFGEAASELEAAVHLRPDDRRVWGYLGYAYARSALHTQAATAFRRAGQHELAAEMERTATSSSQHVDGSVVEDPGELAGMAGRRAASPGEPTPRPVPRSDDTPVPLFGLGAAAGIPVGLSAGMSPTISGAMVTLTDFTTARLLSLPKVAAPVSSLGQGILRFSATADTHVRESALLVALGGPGLSLARRRTRGHLSGQNLASDGERFLRVEGSGELLLSAPHGERGLIAMSLDRDVFYVEEDRAVAWGDEVVWEAGSVPGSSIALLQFRGTGRVVILAGASELVAVRVVEGDRLTVPSARLAGWLGRVVVQGHPSVGMETPMAGLHHVTCEGEGVLLLSQHGEHR
jgi:uncharacterized protein (AIM24 family)